ncbi:putative Apolipoprotein D [Hypsibius exemplaris]|uniref:Apolipoprotein D n=1 Tax=Hypsibius exemplaris TaxID=2072580 RepID=A0A1W0WWT6_HYPEX|nr:putative Apolipoprotein D [Hypsibius exemplaris]
MDSNGLECEFQVHICTWVNASGTDANQIGHRHYSDCAVMLKNLSRMTAARFSLPFLVLSVLTTTQGQVIHFGKCPPVTVANNFFPPLYLGMWYEIAAYPNFVEIGSTCAAVRYTAVGGTAMQLNNTETRRDKSVLAVTGVAIPPDANVLAKYTLTVPQFPKPLPYWILGTDYRNFAVVYSCTFTGFFHSELVWIISRSPTLSATYKSMALNVLATNGIATHPLRDAVQTDCKNY